MAYYKSLSYLLINSDLTGHNLCIRTFTVQAYGMHMGNKKRASFVGKPH
jgi:hypothetical protein